MISGASNSHRNLEKYCEPDKLQDRDSREIWECLDSEERCHRYVRVDGQATVGKQKKSEEEETDRMNRSAAECYSNVDV